MSDSYDSSDSEFFLDNEPNVSEIKNVNQEQMRSVSARWRYEVLMEERRLKALLRDSYEQ